MARRGGTDKACEYVGRFMWSFAHIENAINMIFEVMFNLNAFSCLLLQSNLDLRKKITLIQLGFKKQKINHDKTLKKIHELHNIRNAIVHSTFEHGPSFEGEDGTSYKAGIDFSYVDPRSGNIHVPNPLRDQKRERAKRLAQKKPSKRTKTTINSERTILIVYLLRPRNGRTCTVLEFSSEQ